MSVLKHTLLCVALLTASVSFAQNTDPKPLPVLDVHVHAMDGNFPGLGPMCPNTARFIASDPKGKEEPFGWVKENCTPALYPAAPPARREVETQELHAAPLRPPVGRPLMLSAGDSRCSSG